MRVTLKKEVPYDDTALVRSARVFVLEEVMKKAFQLNCLSENFYSDYNSIKYPEIEQKSSRPYMVLLVELYGNTFAIPFRTNIRHNYCYKFKSSGRPSDAVTGLDFTKAVIVNNQDYIGSPATIDNKEYIELSKKHYFIIKKFKNYVDGYIEYLNGCSNYFNNKKYKYSTLTYFQREILQFSGCERLDDKLHEAQKRSKGSTYNKVIASKERDKGIE